MSKQTKKGKIEPLSLFITKLHSMLEDQTIEPIVSWTQAGDALHIKNITRFTEQVLPVYYKHNNFSSFVRQLNMYGFNKIRHNEGENIYAHRYFRAGRKQDLRKIIRKARDSKESVQIVEHRHEFRGRQKDIQRLKNRQNILEQMCTSYLKQNQKLALQNQELVRKMEAESEEKDRKIEQCLLMFMAQNCPQISQSLPVMCLQNGQSEGSGCRKISPLESLYNRLNQNKSFQQMRSIFYGQANEVPLNQRNNSINEDKIFELQENNPNLDSDGFLSISHFKDIEVQDQINLEESR